MLRPLLLAKPGSTATCWPMAPGAPSPARKKPCPTSAFGHLTLVLPDNALSNMLADGDELARDLWGPGVTAKEAVARLMTVHLEESLETSPSGDLEGTWIYGSGLFVWR